MGIIGGEEAINWGLLGLMLRASTIQWNLCKVLQFKSSPKASKEFKEKPTIVPIFHLSNFLKLFEVAFDGSDIVVEPRWSYDCSL